MPYATSDRRNITQKTTRTTLNFRRRSAVSILLNHCSMWSLTGTQMTVSLLPPSGMLMVEEPMLVRPAGRGTIPYSSSRGWMSPNSMFGVRSDIAVDMGVGRAEAMKRICCFGLTAERVGGGSRARRSQNDRRGESPSAKLLCFGDPWVFRSAMSQAKTMSPLWLDKLRIGLYIYTYRSRWQSDRNDWYWQTGWSPPRKPYSLHHNSC
jgi:hypothetical protein